MLRKVGQIVPLVGAILTSSAFTKVAVTTGTVMVAGTLAGCEDARLPEAHVKRLSDPARRNQAIERLMQFYEDAMTKDKKNRKGPNVKPLLDKIVPPLTAEALKANLGPKRQGKLLSMLADTKDKRAVKALVKALSEYKPDDRSGDSYDVSMGNVVRNLGNMKAKEAAAPMLQLFIELKASSRKAQYKQFYRVLQDAMVQLADPSWEGALIKRLARPIKSMKPKKAKQKKLMNEVYWQSVSALLLGNMKSKKAVPALVKVVLSPFKSNVHVTAISAMIKIGKPAIDAGVKLLNGENSELIKYAADETIRLTEDRGRKVTKALKKSAQGAYKGVAAIIVANIGRKECIGPMLTTIEKGDKTTKAIVARELHKLPADPKVTEAFKKVWESTGLTDNIPPRGNAKDALTVATSSFFDLKLATWMAESSLKLKGEEADTGPIQEQALAIMMKMAGPKEWPLVQKLAAVKITYPKLTTLGKSFKKELATSQKAVKKCGDKADCWVKTMTSSEAQKGQGFLGIKAAYMVALTGGGKARSMLVDSLPKLRNAAVRFVVVSAIDRLSPSGNAATATKLQKMVDKAAASKERKKISATKPLKTVIYRLRARAQ